MPPEPLRIVREGSNLPTTYQRKGREIHFFIPEQDRDLWQRREDGRSITEICRQLDRRSNSVIGRLMALGRREARSEQAAITTNCQPSAPLVDSTPD
jgi:hypothetical protein